MADQNAEGVNGWDSVNSDALANDVKALVGKADLTYSRDLPKADDATLRAELNRLTAPTFESVVIAGFTRIANADDFKAFIEREGPFVESDAPRVPNHYPFWLRPITDEDAGLRGLAGYKQGLIVLSKEDVQSLMNCTQRAISLYKHWAVERRTWALDEGEEG